MFLYVTDKLSLLLKDQVLDGLELINKSFHRGIHKVWILQHLFIPRLRWPLLIYEISVSVVLQLEQKNLFSPSQLVETPSFYD